MLVRSALVVVGTSIAERQLTELKQMFVDYKSKFELDFGDRDSEREAIFYDNVRFIDQVNKEGRSYKLDINEFAHLTAEEFGKMSKGLIPASRKELLRGSPSSADPGKFSYDGTVESLPNKVDHVAGGRVTPVKNQGQCGSCWAFSATGALEGLHANLTGKLVSLSEQELMDCSRGYGDESCSGGLMDNAFKYVRDHGLESEKDYGYKGQDQKCKRNSTKDVIKANTTSFKDVEVNSQNSLLAAIALGPVSVAVEALSSVFQFYSKGVLDSADCGTDTDHGVLAVGYDRAYTKPYYIVKNSWGPSWGDKGYIKIAMNGQGEGICGIQKNASFPVFQS